MTKPRPTAERRAEMLAKAIADALADPACLARMAVRLDPFMLGANLSTDVGWQNTAHPEAVTETRRQLERLHEAALWAASLRKPSGRHSIYGDHLREALFGFLIEYGAYERARFLDYATDLAAARWPVLNPAKAKNADPSEIRSALNSALQTLEKEPAWDPEALASSLDMIKR